MSSTPVTVEQHLSHVLALVAPLAAEQISLGDLASGTSARRVLAEDVHSLLDVPASTPPRWTGTRCAAPTSRARAPTHRSRSGWSATSPRPRSERTRTPPTTTRLPARRSAS
ncbi:hypothetical protein NKG05_15880 [Oerskovia sp. M15]